MAGFCALRPDAQRRRPGQRNPRHRQRSHHPRRLSLSTHPRVGRTLSQRTHLKWLAARTTSPRRTCSSSRATSTPPSTRSSPAANAYAIDHSAKADTQLRQAADLLRSWDGVMSANSAAAAVITAARQAFWPLVLKPKLGDDWRLYRWGEKSLCRGGDRHPPPSAMASNRLRQLG